MGDPIRVPLGMRGTVELHPETGTVRCSLESYGSAVTVVLSAADAVALGAAFSRAAAAAAVHEPKKGGK